MRGYLPRLAHALARAMVIPLLTCPICAASFRAFGTMDVGWMQGRTFGTAQYDAVQNWEAVFTYQRAQVKNTEKISGAIRLESEQGTGTAQQGGSWATSHAHIGPSVNNAARTAPETRPRNVALLACIKI